MRKAAGKRLPHGTTLALVFDAVSRLHQKKGGGLARVSRAELMGELSLPQTTVDDRLRILTGQGRLVSAGRGLYQPNTKPIPRLPHPSKPPGTKLIATDSDGNPVQLKWL